MILEISHSDAIDLLGRDQDDPKIKNLLNRLGVSFSDIKISDKDILNRSMEFKKLSLSINFEDIGQLKKIPLHDIGDGPYILEDLTFWGNEEGFSGRIDFPVTGLTFNSNFEELVTKLGQPTKRFEDSTRPVAWLREGYKLVIQWTEDPRKIRNITYWLTDLEEKSKAFR